MIYETVDELPDLKQANTIKAKLFFLIAPSFFLNLVNTQIKGIQKQAVQNPSDIFCLLTIRHVLFSCDWKFSKNMINN